MDKPKVAQTKGPAPKAATAAPLLVPKTPPLFRRIDWFTFLLVFLVVEVAYVFTLAPDLTLEDSGELAVASFYAGIPHPPGYPVWTLYTWLWANLIPFSNIAWRVALGEATAGALACGFLGLIVSRGSSMLMEGLEELADMTGRWENAICVVSGFVAGGLLAFNGYMWSQSVIVEVYSFSVLSLVLTMLWLLRWIYAPHQRRWLYLAMFMFGICFTNHQSLLVAAMGIQIAVAAAQPRLGREMFLWNSVVYVLGLVAKGMGELSSFNSAPGQLNMLFVIFNFVGIGSIAAYFVLAIRTKEWFQPRLFGAATWCGVVWLIGASFYLYMAVSGMTNPPMQWGYPRTEEGFIHALTRGQYEKANPTNFLTDPMRFVMQLGMLIEGVAEEFSWVFMFVALVPFLFFFRMKQREKAWLAGVAAIYLCLGVLLMILLNPPPDRAARELIRVFFTASHVCVALLVGYGLTLVAAYMATHYLRFRLFGLVGGAVAVFLALLTLGLDSEYLMGGDSNQGPLAGFFAAVTAAFQPGQYGLPVFAGLILLGTAVVFTLGLILYRNRAPLAIALAMFAAMPIYSFLTHWADNEQRGHLFGFWFGHDMFTPPFNDKDGKPLYPEMAKDAILYGGTDPGRFCPTYTIFCESFIPPHCKRDPKYDRRDVYIITQNALADGTYLMYIRAHYNKSAQVKYDSPFFQEVLRSRAESEQNLGTNLLARAVLPLDRFFTWVGDRVERDRRAGSSFFKPDQFTNPGALVERLRPSEKQDAVSKWLFTNLGKDTQQLVTGGGDEKRLRAALASDLNVLLERELLVKQQIAELTDQKHALENELLGSTPSDRQQRKLAEWQKQIDELGKVGSLYDPERFKDVKVSEFVRGFIAENPESHTRIRLNRRLLEEAYPGLLTPSQGGVYPDREMLIATPEDSQRCFQEYLKDAERRVQHDQTNPNGPRLLKPGEDVRIVNEGGQQRVQVSGQVAVMSINGLLTKVMFDKNPNNEFYVEESFPLDWMYPHLTPFGIIMKINRQPLPELNDDICRRDHEFWKQFSNRLIGDWIDYDTPVSNIVAFAEKTYLRRNLQGFKGDPKFVRDDQAQKAFSKLRSSIGGVYAWRVANAKSVEEQQRMIKEADFTFKQAFAYCPYSPEAVFRYVQLLINLGRIEDAYQIANTCLKLDPYNGQVQGLVDNLRAARGQPPPAPRATPVTMNLPQMEADYRAHPENFQAGFNLASAYMAVQQTNRATEVLDQMVSHPKVDINAVLMVARLYATMMDFGKLETTLSRLTEIAPENAEGWYDFAALKATLGKTGESLPALQKALQLSAARRATDPNASNLVEVARQDPRFAALRTSPDFQKLVPPAPPK